LVVVFHEPVLLKEALEYLNIKPGERYIDATVGGGGHSAAIIRRSGVVLGIDADQEAVKFAKKRLAAEFSSSKFQFSIIRGNFKNIGKIARDQNFYPVSGILYDFGLSSHQLEHSGRGFSFLKDEPLDMRFDPNLKVAAADIVNELSKDELTELFRKYGEEPESQKIALEIVKRRKTTPIETSKQLADLVSGVKGRRELIHPATRVFQALRIAVNDELSSLQSSLPQALELLERGGRLVVISFHSLEDRIVKQFFAGSGRLLTKKPVVPSAEEVRENPRARGAKLRALEKL
jgi:16S rRNA (cytosine1402-N4)-methyltransferase